MEGMLHSDELHRRGQSSTPSSYLDIQMWRSVELEGALDLTYSRWIN